MTAVDADGNPIVLDEETAEGEGEGAGAPVAEGVDEGAEGAEDAAAAAADEAAADAEGAAPAGDDAAAEQPTRVPSRPMVPSRLRELPNKVTLPPQRGRPCE